MPNPEVNKKQNKYNQRILYTCGLIAPPLFILMTILGGALRPGYNQITDTVSELFTVGSPNKTILDAIHILYAMLMILFGIGVLNFVLKREGIKSIGKIGANLYITANVVSLFNAAFFPQDPWGTTPTTTGQLHIILAGVVGLLSILGILCLGLWFISSRISSGFGIYSLVTVVATVFSALFFVMTVNSPLMGLAERISILLGFIWTFTLAVLLLVLDKSLVDEIE